MKKLAAKLHHKVKYVSGGKYLMMNDLKLFKTLTEYCRWSCSVVWWSSAFFCCKWWHCSARTFFSSRCSEINETKIKYILSFQNQSCLVSKIFQIPSCIKSRTWEEYVDGLVQERRHSIANALELQCFSCTNPLICKHAFKFTRKYAWH